MISLLAADWNFKFGKMPKHPTTAGDGWKFEFPYSLPSDRPPELNSVNYLNTTHFDKLILNQTLRMTFQVTQSDDVVFEYGFGVDNPGTRPANVRFYLQKGLILSNFANTRWWSNPVSMDLVLAKETVTIEVILTPAAWSNINGQMGDTNETTINGFNTAVAKAGKIGITFGGGSFFGHGVWVSQGSAEFVLTDYSIS